MKDNSRTRNCNIYQYRRCKKITYFARIFAQMVEYGSSDRLLCLICHFWKCNLPIDLHVRRLAVCRLVGWSICHNFRKRQEVTLPCSYWSTCINYAQIFSTIEAQRLDLCETGPVALRVYEKKGDTPSTPLRSS